MMLKSNLPATSLFLTLITMAAMLAVASMSWVMLWFSMELNLISLLPIIMNHNTLVIETSTKYFIMQSIGSHMFLMSTLMPEATPLSLLLLLGTLLKMGASPFHQWFPTMMMTLSWYMIIMMSTWQKFIPLFILSELLAMWSFYLLLIITIFNAGVGALGGLNQSHIRSLMAYSSITHLSWMVSGSAFDKEIMYSYLFIYSLTNITIVLNQLNLNKYLSTKHACASQMSKSIFTVNTLLFMSLFGAPPFMGFLNKWLMLMVTMPISTTISTILILSSMVSLFYYSMMFLMSSLTPSTSLPMTLPHSPPSSLVIAFTLSSLPLANLMI